MLSPVSVQDPGDSIPTDAQIAQMTEKDAQASLSRLFGRAYDRALTIDNRWTISWYEMADDNAEVEAELNGLRKSLLEAIPSELDWPQVVKLAQKAGTGEAELKPLRATFDEITKLSSTRIDAQLKWMKLREIDDESQTDPLEDQVSDAEDKMLDEVYAIAEKAEALDTVDSDLFWEATSDYTRAASLFWRFSILVDPNKPDLITVGMTYEGSQLKEGDVIFAIGEDKEDAEWESISSIADIAKYYAANDVEGRRFRVRARRNGQEIIVSEDKDKDELAGLIGPVN